MRVLVANILIVLPILLGDTLFGVLNLDELNAKKIHPYVFSVNVSSFLVHLSLLESSLRVQASLKIFGMDINHNINDRNYKGVVKIVSRKLGVLS